MSPAEHGLNGSVIVVGATVKHDVEQAMRYLAEYLMSRPIPNFVIGGLTSGEVVGKDGDLMILPECTTISAEVDPNLEHFQEIIKVLGSSGVSMRELQKCIISPDVHIISMEEACRRLSESTKITKIHLEDFKAEAEDIESFEKVKHRNNPINPHFKIRKNWKQKRKNKR